MRHVLEKLNYANRSMKHKLVLYMAAMGLLLAAVLLFSAPQAANKTTSAIKNAAHKKRFNAKTPP